MCGHCVGAPAESFAALRRRSCEKSMDVHMYEHIFIETHNMTLYYSTIQYTTVQCTVMTVHLFMHMYTYNVNKKTHTYHPKFAGCCVSRWFGSPQADL